MITDEQRHDIEQQARKNYNQLVGKLIVLDRVYGFRDDELEIVDFPVPIIARVSQMDDVGEWTGDYFDSAYDIEIISKTDLLEEVEGFHTFGQAHAVSDTTAAQFSLATEVLEDCEVIGLDGDQVLHYGHDVEGHLYSAGLSLADWQNGDAEAWEMTEIEAARVGIPDYAAYLEHFRECRAAVGPDVAAGTATP